MGAKWSKSQRVKRLENRPSTGAIKGADKEKGRQGEFSAAAPPVRSPCLPFSLSPCLLATAELCLRRNHLAARRSRVMLSIIIPVFNEAESLHALYSEINGTCAAGQIEAEIIFIDDGSTDGSWTTVRELAARDSRVRGLRFRRNFGKAAALSAGVHTGHGGVLCMC